MIKNLDAEGVQAKIDTETGAEPVVKAIYDAISSASGEYEINPDGHGLEFLSTTEVRGFPNRCRVKVFQTKDDKIFAWFYKPSAVHFSRDRYSLGGVLIDKDKFNANEADEMIAQWLVWLDSGLDPAQRPENWKSAVPYDIPY